jgi:heme/copper-type cytochrome/quinol oxidase subunit 2
MTQPARLHEPVADPAATPPRRAGTLWTLAGLATLVALCSGCDDAALSRSRQGGWPGPPAPLEAGVTGQDSRWTFSYPGVDGELGTADDRQATEELVLPAMTQVTLRLASADALYFFAVPELDLREAAAPGLAFQMAFHSGPPASYAIVGDPMCGVTHPGLRGKLRVASTAQFLAWLDRLPVGVHLAQAGAGAAPKSIAAR